MLETPSHPLWRHRTVIYQIYLGVIHHVMDHYLFIAVPTTEEVVIGISDVHYTTVTTTIREQMYVCAHLSSPVPKDIDIERPCPTGAMGRYIYVVQVLESASKGNMQIHELRAFSCTCCSWNVAERIMYEAVNEERRLFCTEMEWSSGWQLT